MPGGLFAVRCGLHYDQGGNILSKKRYVYTEPDVEITDTTPVQESVAFSYTNANWKDQLKFVNDVEIHYDEIGNPIQVGAENDVDKITYVWEKGRQLKSMNKNGVAASFKYNENGLRIQKTVNGVVTDYTLHGKNIVHMTQGNNNLHFFYDASNKPAIVEYNGTKYAYVHNLQGDIVAILDNNGAAVVQYKYDAWGKPISKTGNMAGTLGTVQPFRYRGYVYDEETGVYYLRSRYLDARRGIFLSADVLYIGNLYAYCTGNPVSYCDRNGYAMVCCLDENGDCNVFNAAAMGGNLGGGIALAERSIAWKKKAEEYRRSGISDQYVADLLASDSYTTISYEEGCYNISINYEKWKRQSDYPINRLVCDLLASNISNELQWKYGIDNVDKSQMSAEILGHIILDPVACFADVLFKASDQQGDVPTDSIDLTVYPDGKVRDPRDGYQFGFTVIKIWNQIWH